MKATRSYLFAAAMYYRCSLAWTSAPRGAGGSARRTTILSSPRPPPPFPAPSALARRISAYNRGGASQPGAVAKPSESSSATNYSTLLATTSSTQAERSNEHVPAPSSTDSDDLSELLPLISKPRPRETFGGLYYYDLGDLFRVVFVLGGPGAGKGTQSGLIESHYPVCHLSVGELLRNVPDDSPHRELIESSLVSGKIVPVEVSLSLLRRAMEEKAEELGRETIFLVDGFPRNFDNLRGWCRVMSDASVIASVLVYQCPLPVLEARIVERGKDSGRSDDNLGSVKRRFRTFETDTLPVIEALRSAASSSSRGVSSSSSPGTESSSRTNWRVVDIRGDRTLEAVWLDTQRVMNRLVLNDILRANAALLRAVKDSDPEAYRGACDPEWFRHGRDAREVMELQEGAGAGQGEVANAQVDVISGTHVAVSYDRVLQGQPLREKRIWSHKGKLGWRNVHFSRIPTTQAES